MTTRDRILEVAAQQIGNYGKGSREVRAIWRDVLPPTWNDFQVWQYADSKEWCGGFALHCLRLAGVTDAHWQDGIGFIGPLHLHRVPWPKPGDIAVKELPFAHHMVVEYWNNDNDWGDIAGNTPFAARHKHGSSVGIAYYSIDPLLSAADTDPAPAFAALRFGAQGPEVIDLQNLLNAHGALLTVDGRFGPETATAVMSFQRRSALDADGVVGPATWVALHQ